MPKAPSSLPPIVFSCWSCTDKLILPCGWWERCRQRAPGRAPGGERARCFPLAAFWVFLNSEGEQGPQCWAAPEAFFFFFFLVTLLPGDACQCVAGAMYITGFAESTVSDLLSLRNIWAVRGISVAVLLALLGINLAGVKWIIRLQLLLLLLLCVHPGLCGGLFHAPGPR